jgi:biotin carboxylase
MVKKQAAPQKHDNEIISAFRNSDLVQDRSINSNGSVISYNTRVIADVAAWVMGSKAARARDRARLPCSVITWVSTNGKDVAATSGEGSFSSNLDFVER